MPKVTVSGDMLGELGILGILGNLGGIIGDIVFVPNEENVEIALSGEGLGSLGNLGSIIGDIIIVPNAENMFCFWNVLKRYVLDNFVFRCASFERWRI